MCTYREASVTHGSPASFNYVGLCFSGVGLCVGVRVAVHCLALSCKLGEFAYERLYIEVGLKT